MCIIAIVAGLIICFLGRKLFRPILFIAGIMLGVCLVWLICYSTFLKSDSRAWVFYVVLVISLLIGLAIGYLLFKLAKIGAFILAGWGGYTLGLLLYNAFMYKVASGQAFFWCWTLGLALVCAILALCLFEHVLILSTSLLGSFLVINGIGLVAGHY